MPSGVYRLLIVTVSCIDSLIPPLRIMAGMSLTDDADPLEVGFAAFLTLFVGIMVALALTYGPTSRLVPLVVGVPTVVALALVTLSYVFAPVEGLVSRFNASPVTVDSDLFDAGETVYVERPVLRALAWTIGLLVAMYLFGFVLVIPFFVYAYLTREGGHGRRRAALIGVLAAVTVSGLFEIVFATPLYPGAVPTLLQELLLG